MTKDEGCKYGEDIGDDCILGVDGGGIFASWRCYRRGSSGRPTSDSSNNQTFISTSSQL